MKYLLSITLLLFSTVVSANSFVEIIGAEEDQDSYLQVSAVPFEEVVSAKMPHFELTQGLLKTNIVRLTDEFLPSHEVVWALDDRLEQYSNVTLVGDSYEDILEQIARQYVIGACIRPNNVVEMYDIKANRFYCED
ncbi:hypothetical protein [Shewanella aestuarii]|uniref:Toxin co-regulated pilus biosynthesis protein Q C-terminal domain-containing protein n=1 Tax=Shewanella aestuarii TaxID=1028752 RepID=A0A6G9QR53_9GAMM|nr:hypothetical protein [Shewanella aestuarii]QIR16535.1 hypothetical protein HBH39_18840 [Shewanella aestuarii]